MLNSLPLSDIQESLHHRFDVRPEIVRGDPLAQWGVPTACRLHLSWAERNGAACPATAVAKIKGAGQDYDPSDLRAWRPAWKLAQDYVNLSFLEKVGAGRLAPELYGYSRETAFVLMEDAGPRSLHDALMEEGAEGAGEFVVDAARALGHVHGLALPHAEKFGDFAQSLLPGYEPLGNSVGLAEKNPFGLLDVQRHFGLVEMPSLMDVATSVAEEFAYGSPWIGYGVGDLWHQHVILPESEGIRFIDFHCGGVGNVLGDLMRLLDGTPLYEKKCLPDGIVAEAKEAYLGALREALPARHPLRSENELHTRSSFERNYAVALVNHCWAICCREWIQLRRHNEGTSQLVRLAMGVGRETVEKHLPEMTPMAELFGRVEKWFEANCPASGEAKIGSYRPLR